MSTAGVVKPTPANHVLSSHTLASEVLICPDQYPCDELCIGVRSNPRDVEDESMPDVCVGND